MSESDQPVAGTMSCVLDKVKNGGMKPDLLKLAELLLDLDEIILRPRGWFNAEWLKARNSDIIGRAQYLDAKDLEEHKRQQSSPKRI